MNDAAPSPPSREEAVRAHKRLLQGGLDRRPSGTRQKIAEPLGKHKSFVSQITNPACSAPVPARHLGAISEIRHLAPEERASFVAADRIAHPCRSRAIEHEAGEGDAHVIQIGVPNLGGARLRRELEEIIRHAASRIIALLLRR
jgi:hypothetical protein